MTRHRTSSSRRQGAAQTRRATGTLPSCRYPLAKPRHRLLAVDGGAMSLLAGALGYVLLADPVQARPGQPRCGLARPAWK